MLKKIFKVPKSRADVLSILHLPLLERLTHHKARRPMVVVGIGTGMMVAGSVIAANREALAEMLPIHHLLFDTLGYFIHAAGALPALRYVEPLWLLLLGSAEDAAAEAASVGPLAEEVIDIAKEVGEKGLGL